MNKRGVIAGGLVAVLAVGLVACGDKEVKKLETDEAKVAYSLGFMTGKTSAEHVPTLDLNVYQQGMKDAYAKKDGLLTEAQMEETLMNFQKKLMEEQQKKQETAASEAVEKGKAFLAENAKKAGVTTTASGLQYEVLKEGAGAKPKASSAVKVHYEGKLLDGTVFDSSIARGEPVSFQLNQVIAGWTEGVQLMSPGAKYRFTIPSELAYGASGAGPIPPNSVLVFEVELLEVK